MNNDKPDLKVVETRKWSDKPLYETNQESDVREDLGYKPLPSDIQKPTYKWYTKSLRKSAPTPSPLMCWHLEESRKRSSGMENEIDLAEIKAAAKGVKNQWEKTVIRNKTKIQKMIETDKFDWHQLIEWRNDNARAI